MFLRLQYHLDLIYIKLQLQDIFREMFLWNDIMKQNTKKKKNNMLLRHVYKDNNAIFVILKPDGLRQTSLKMWTKILLFFDKHIF